MIHQQVRYFMKIIFNFINFSSTKGSTPEKRKFILPSDLYRTQPHPVLIEQYRGTKNHQNLSKSLECKASNLRKSKSLESISSVKKTSIDLLPEINKENAVVIIESKTKQIAKSSVMKQTLTLQRYSTYSRVILQNSF